MNDTDAQQPTEPPGKADKLATARDQAVGKNANGRRWCGGRDHRDDGGGSGHHDDTRHDSSSFQLILSERALGRFELLCQRHRARARTGLVLVNSRGEYHSFPERRPTMGELLWKGTGTLYEVDMGRHWTSLEFDLPSREEAFPFHAIVDVEWCVINPTKVVRDGVNDVRESLSPSLRHQLSTITRQFDVEDTAAAEKAAFKWLTDHSIGCEYGLQSRAFLRMRMDDPTVTHVAAIREVRRKIELEPGTQELNLRREESAITLLTRRVEFYRDIILDGDCDQFALQLAQNPHEVGTVIQMLRDERHGKLRTTTDFVTRLLDSGAIERHDIYDQVRTLLDWLKESTDTIIRGPERPARILVQRDSDEFPPTDVPESDPPDSLPVDPVRPPGDAPTHGAGKL